jgi:hypothetical protein
VLRDKQLSNREAVVRLKADAQQRAEDLRGIVDAIRAKGTTSVRALAAELTAQAIASSPSRSSLRSRRTMLPMRHDGPKSDLIGWFIKSKHRGGIMQPQRRTLVIG